MSRRTQKNTLLESIIWQTIYLECSIIRSRTSSYLSENYVANGNLFPDVANSVTSAKTNRSEQWHLIITRKFITWTYIYFPLLLLPKKSNFTNGTQTLGENNLIISIQERLGILFEKFISFDISTTVPVENDITSVT